MATVNELVVELATNPVDELEWLVRWPAIDDPANTLDILTEVDGEIVEQTILATELEEAFVATVLQFDDAAPNVADESTYRATTWVEELASPSDTLIASSTTPLLVEELRVPRDSTTYTTGWLVSEFAPPADEVFYNSAILITEPANTGDAHWVRSDSTYLLDSVAVAADEIVERRAAPILVDESTSPDDEWSFRLNLALTEQAAPADELILGAGNALLLESEAAETDAEAFARVTVQAFLEEVASPTDWWFLGNSAAKAWLMNPESTAMVLYDNWQFYDMMQVGGKTYALGPAGLVEVGANDDDGREVVGELGYAYTDFGSDRVKRMGDVWVGYTATKPLSLTVDVYNRSGYTYDMPEKDAEEAVNNRIRPGKGLSGRYWRFTIKNTDGGRFRIDDIIADVLGTGRRS